MKALSRLIIPLSWRPSMTSTPFFVVVTCLATFLAACDGKPVGNTAPPPPSVTVSKPLQKSITEWDEYTGRFTAIETVEIRARVSGFIESIHFRDGQIVKQGDLLFVIDPRPYRITVEQAKSDLERAQAKFEIASHDVDRATPLARNQTITDRELDTRKSIQRDAAGGVGSADAALKQAELNLEWTSVRAPISGRISDRRVDACNLIVGGSTGATLLSAIVSVDPIQFVFDAARPISSATCDWPRPEPGRHRAMSRIPSRCVWPTRRSSGTKGEWISSTTWSIRRRAPFAVAPSSTTRMAC
jgi:membrane fusion protein, multidrug efflux system